MQTRVTIKDVAKAAGVSITTVSRYLNQQYDAMSEATRQRIGQVIQELGYRPNKLAQGLRGASHSVAAIVVNLGYPFCIGVIRALSDALQRAGCSLMVYESGGDATRERALLETVWTHQVEGLVIQTNGDNNDLLADLANRLPVVIVDRQFPVAKAHNVITNNHEASEQLVDALFEAGYERVLYVTEPLEGISTRTDRLNGYTASCQRHHREPWVAWVRRGDPRSMQDAATMLKPGKTSCGPQAVYTANGLVMLELYPHLKQLGLAVPQELGIATFDDPDWAHVASPPLTCVRQPTAAIGACAADIVLSARAGENPSPASLQVFASDLVWRASADLR
ncbi:MAG: LacI family transcriptional regulator [Alicyclobacillus herbarius]|nr:LacI family transcriptional regulator [Alicyclobacillus herbarius]